MPKYISPKKGDINGNNADECNNCKIITFDHAFNERLQLNEAAIHDVALVGNRAQQM